jgi:uncharacterized protein (TIGR02246 family)
MTPEDFPRSFAALWAARDAAGLAALLTEDADVITLTGAAVESRGAAEAIFRAEMTGVFARSRLVTGKTRLRPVWPDTAVLHQRFVLSGLVDAQGQDAGRVAAVLSAVLAKSPEGWLAMALQFTAVES